MGFSFTHHSGLTSSRSEPCDSQPFVQSHTRLAGKVPFNTVLDAPANKNEYNPVDSIHTRVRSMSELVCG